MQAQERSAIARVLDACIAPRLREDAESLRSARIIAATALVATLLLPFFAVRNLVLGSVKAAVVVLVLEGFAVALLTAVRAGRPLAHIGHAMGVGILGGGIAVSLARGGFLFAPLGACLLVPPALVLILGRRAAIGWSAFVVASVGGLALASRAGVFGLSGAHVRDFLPFAGYMSAALTLALVQERALRDAEAQREQLARHAAASQRLDSLGHLAAGIAHDFNNLLTVFRTSASCLLEELPAGHTSRADAAAIGEAAERGASITQHLLAFARTGQGELTTFDLAAAVGEMGGLLQRVLTKRVTLGIERSSEPLFVRGDLRQVEQVLLNLVVNARDAMPTGGTVTVTVARRELASGNTAQLAAGTYVGLSVRDEGEGIPEHVLRHIFEPFYSTKPRGQGTGLGLATAHAVVRALGGAIAVDTTVGAGTRFDVFMPESDASSVANKKSDPPTVASAKTPSNGTVLVVDDHPAILTLAARVLKRGGFTVLEASTPTEAIALAKEHPAVIHALLTDVAMPELSGVDLARRIRLERPEIAVVYMTGYTDEGDVARQVEAGEARLVRKPFASRDLVDALSLATSAAPSAS